MKNLNKKAANARKTLEKRNNELTNVLEKYRSSNKLCLDITLMVIFLALIGLMIGILKKKSFF